MYIICIVDRYLIPLCIISVVCLRCTLNSRWNDAIGIYGPQVHCCLMDQFDRPYKNAASIHILLKILVNMLTCLLKLRDISKMAVTHESEIFTNWKKKQKEEAKMLSARKRQENVEHLVKCKSTITKNIHLFVCTI